MLIKLLSTEDLESRLSAYYGPALPEQPLSYAAWQQLRLQLPPRPQPRRRLFRRLHFAHRRQHIPASIREAWNTILYDAHCYYPVQMLRYIPLKVGRMPGMRVNLWLRPRLDLFVSSDLQHASRSPVELDVLLATGLARFRLISKRFPHLDLWFFLSFCLLVSVAALACMLFRLPLAAAVIVFLCCSLLLLWFRRIYLLRICYQADVLAVHWLGRERICQGLHALARYHHSRASWSEPSLASRILRICGTNSELGTQRMTLAR